MVVFTCNNCGESLQKPKVEKHYSFSCRGAKNLTCVDCFKDFKGEEYAVHIKCITEGQRYGGKDHVEKVKKGEVKQESWMEMIKSIIMHETNVSSGCKYLLNTICNFNNVPRKKSKFFNFIKSSTGGKATVTDIEGVWNLIEKYKTEKSNTTTNHENSNQVDEKKRKADQENGTEAKKSKVENEEKLSKKKSKQNGESEQTNGHVENAESNGNNDDADKFSMVDQITALVAKKDFITLEKLEKEILKKYKKVNGDDIDLDKFTKKFNKKLKKIDSLEVVTIVRIKST